MTEFRWPGATDKTVVVGTNGSGKTIGAAYILANQNFKRRPWVIIDFKNEEFWDKVQFPPIQRLRFGQMPGRLGLYFMPVNPGQEDDLEAWLWKIWKRENVGLFCDEVALVPKGNAFKAIMRQGRSKHIPVISCTQRPVGVDREIFSESLYKMVFSLEDRRDEEVVQEFTRGYPKGLNLPRYWSYWYDGKQRQSFILQPVPDPDRIARDLRERVPFGWTLW